MFNKIFGIKKEAHVAVPNSQASAVHDSVDQDGYVHLSSDTPHVTQGTCT